MTQAQLVNQLKAKLEFKEYPERSGYSTLKGKPPKSRPKKVGSVQLGPPGSIMLAPAFVSFDLSESGLLAHQARKLENETGLDPSLLELLAECPLDAEVARLIFCANKLARITRDNVEIDTYACVFVRWANDWLVSPAHPSTFWTPQRRQFRRRVMDFLRDIRDGIGNANYDETKMCIQDFLDRLEADWGLS
jgi:hypothetical protein